MQQPLYIHIPGDVKGKTKSVRIRPDFCRFAIPYASCDLIPFSEASILRQQSHHFGFFLQLFEILASGDINLDFSVLMPTAFLVFMLEGAMTFHDDQGEQISQAMEKTFYACYNGVVTYSARIKKGIHRILVVALPPEYLYSEQENLPEFGRLISHLADGSQELVILPSCHIGQTAWTLLEKMISYTSPDKVERGSGIFHLLTKCLAIYHGLIQSGHYLPTQVLETDAKRLADYFKLNYATEKVNRLADISSELNLSEWKIIKLSKTLFNKSPHQYVMYLRMDTAQKLIRQTTMSIKDIALTVGFDNKAYFSNAFHKFYGISPAEFRKKV